LCQGIGFSRAAKLLFKWKADILGNKSLGKTGKPLSSLSCSIEQDSFPRAAAVSLCIRYRECLDLSIGRFFGTAKAGALTQGKDQGQTMSSL
jgi:hypothetical protein